MAGSAPANDTSTMKEAFARAIVPRNTSKLLDHEANCVSRERGDTKAELILFVTLKVTLHSRGMSVAKVRVRQNVE